MSKYFVSFYKDNLRRVKVSGLVCREEEHTTVYGTGLLFIAFRGFLIHLNDLCSQKVCHFVSHFTKVDGFLGLFEVVELRREGKVPDFDAVLVIHDAVFSHEISVNDLKMKCKTGWSERVEFFIDF